MITGDFVSGRGGPILILTPIGLFFSISKPVSFKKLNRVGWSGLAEMGNSQTHRVYILFIYLFIIFNLFICYIKIKIFHKK